MTHKAHSYMLPYSPLRSLLARFGLAAVFSLVSVAESQKVTTLTFGMTCDVVQINCKLLVESSRLPPLPPRYGHWFASQAGAASTPDPSGARSAEYHSGA